MNSVSFFNGLGSLAATTIGSLGAAGIIGNGSTPTTHITTQVPGGGSQTITIGSGLSGAFSSPEGTGYSWLLLIGVAILAYATYKHFAH